MAKSRKSTGKATSAAAGNTRGFSNTSLQITNNYLGGLIKDTYRSYLDPKFWTHARNAINNSTEGDVGVLGNEPANLECGVVPYTIIGAIHLYADEWIIFSTDNSSSEIGRFDDSECSYTTLVNDDCLNFNKQNLITGAAKENFDCTWQIYFDDGRNPSRSLNVDDVPYIQVAVDSNADCIEYENILPLQLDCEKIRLAPLMETPCIRLMKGESGGQLRNGMYQAFIAYTVNGQVQGDYIGISNLQSLFDHDVNTGSLRVTFDGLDQDFEEFELVILSNNQQEIVAKRIGLYSTNTVSVEIDFIDQALITIPLSRIPLIRPAYERSEQMYVVGDYLIRSGPTEQFDFNYQPLANQIRTEFVVAEYPANYYYNGGNKVGYMRDEVYSFFIRFIYNTGERSNSYHIPGRVARGNGGNQQFIANKPAPGSLRAGAENGIATGADVLDTGELNFQVYNTARLETFSLNPAPSNIVGAIGGPVDPNDPVDPGRVIARGEMAYWESTEVYPNKPEVWNSTYTDPNTNINIGNTSQEIFDLCGQHIRHHKMPNEDCGEALYLTDNSNSNEKIRLLGVDFSNIRPPVFNDGTQIPNIVGYEILRGSREGNKSILAKGIFRNMREYTPVQGTTFSTGDIDNRTLYPNYPYNELDGYEYETTNGTFDGPGDVFFWQPETITLPNGVQGIQTNVNPALNQDNSSYPNTINGDSPPITGYRKDVFTFHSPELSFKRPFLNAFETRLYAQRNGESSGRFINSEGHPGFKLLRNNAIIFSTLLGMGYGLQNLQGKTSRTVHPIQMNYLGFVGPHKQEVEGGKIGRIRPNLPSTLNIPKHDITAYSTNAKGEEDNKNPQGAIAPGRDDISEEVAEASAKEAAEQNEETHTGAFGENLDIDFSGGFQGVIDSVKDAKNGMFNKNFVGLINNEDATLSELLSGSTFNPLGDANLTTAGALPGTTGGGTTITLEGGLVSRLPIVMRTFYGLSLYFNAVSDGGQEIIEAILNFSSFYNLDLKYISEGFYYNTDPIAPDTRFRSQNLDAAYVGSSFQNFGDGFSNRLFKINNLFRPNTVAIQTDEELPDPIAVVDNSRISLGRVTEEETTNPERFRAYKYLSNTWKRNISVNYGGLKFQFANQYGQLEGIRQVPIRDCIRKFDKRGTQRTGPMFGGDTYIGRHTEKTIMPIFTKFLNGQPDGFAFQYLNHINIPYPRYWVDSTKFSLREGINALTQSVANIALSILPGVGGNTVPVNDKFNLDINPGAVAGSIIDLFSGGLLPERDPNKFSIMTSGYFYTHICGVQDFYVESEVNLAQRDYENDRDKRFYDIYQYNDLQELFHADIIKESNFFKYDYSLSASRFITNLVSFGSIQQRDYDPNVAENCFTFYPKRLIYSLPAQDEAKKDFWRVFLPNNYKDFVNKVTVIKSINGTGAIMFFPYQSPKMFTGVDQLETDLGTKITIGDGGLFEQALQNVANSESGYEYGSAESTRGVLNTPFGVFFVSQKQGKIFQYAGQLAAISDAGMKQWFNNYLPSQLLAQYPEMEEHPLADNPVVGIGCQVIYDENYNIVYFCKKDYKVKDEFVNDIVFDKERGFIRKRAAGRTAAPTLPVLNPAEPPPSPEIEVGDPTFFDDVSWTVSYDPKAKAWISFHDWHPELVMPSTDHFFTTKTDKRDGSASIWRHNDRCDLFTNYYGKNYPFEIETPVTTGINIATIRSLEYQLESYVYRGTLGNACADDRWHDLDYNFDEAIIYNSEQVSGQLNLTLTPKGDPFAARQYPIINPSSIDVLYSKEEQKYRINQFWDITNDRGEFNPNIQQTIFNTDGSGYKRALNLNNLDYNKPALQRKKFRHYQNNILLKKRISGDRKMLFKINTTKQLASFR